MRKTPLWLLSTKCVGSSMPAWMMNTMRDGQQRRTRRRRKRRRRRNRRRSGRRKEVEEEGKEEEEEGGCTGVTQAWPRASGKQKTRWPPISLPEIYSPRQSRYLNTRLVTHSGYIYFLSTFFSLSPRKNVTCTTELAKDHIRYIGSWGTTRHRARREPITR